MAVGDKNNLGGKENLPEYDFAVSPKKGSSQKFFFQNCRRYSLFSKKGLHQKLQAIFKNDSSIV